MLTNFKTVIKEKNRMCKSFEECEKCFLDEKIKEFNYEDCNEFMESDPELFAHEITRWAENNPRKTNEDIFLLKFNLTPWVEKNENGYVRCGYKECNEKLPCNDCPWWKEPLNAEWDERYYEEPVVENKSNEIVIKDSNILSDETNNNDNDNYNNDIENVTEERLEPQNDTSNYEEIEDKADKDNWSE